MGRCLVPVMQDGNEFASLAVAKLFWNSSHWKTLGRAGKLGHLQDQDGTLFHKESGSEG